MYVPESDEVRREIARRLARENQPVVDQMVNGDGGALWRGTPDELDSVIALVHADTDCPDCQADPHACCLNAASDNRCAGHTLLVSQPTLDLLLVQLRLVG